MSFDDLIYFDPKLGSAVPVSDPAELKVKDRRWLMAMAAMTLFAIACGAFVASGLMPYRLGQVNADPPLIGTKLEFYALVAWGFAQLALLLMFIRRAPTRKWLVVFVPAAFISLPVVHKLSPRNFQSGWNQWIISNIEEVAIRKWALDLSAFPPPSTNPVMTQWPAEILKLSPIEVKVLQDRSVILKWGHEGTWGDARVVVIDNTISHPADISDIDGFRYPFKPVSPGVRAAVQIQN